MPIFTFLKRGQKKVPDDIIVNRRGGNQPKRQKRGRWEEVGETETTLGLDTLGQALKDTGFNPNSIDDWG